MQERTQEFDYVIVGGGSAGCVLADRLSRDPNNRVCLLEAGSEGNTVMTTTPGAFGYFMFSRKYNWRFQGKAEPDILKGQKPFTPRGKMLGGSSSVNAMVYIRGDKTDYDHWASLGNKGWSYTEVLPHFKRVEQNENGADEFHGGDGPLYVSNCTPQYPLTEAFIEAGQQVGYPLNKDYNGASLEGVGAFQFTIKDGERCGAKRAFLAPAMARPNLTVLTYARATRVLFDGKKAVGVALQLKGKATEVKARKEVILASGSINSPQLLLLSGVGAKADLEPHGIEQVHELPGVGKNLQEHPDLSILVTSKKRDGVTIGPSSLIPNLKNLLRYIKDKSGPLASSVTESGGFIKSDDSIEVPDLQLHFVPLMFNDHGRDLAAMTKHGYSLHVCLLRPKSRGSLTLASADPLADPVIDYQFLTHEDDVKAMVSGVRKVREILAAPRFDEYRGVETFPGEDKQSDEELAQAVRDNLSLIYHPAGTCKMGNDEMAVVDDQLRVHGMENLRVIDASIMPTVVTGNTNAPTIMIADKGADMILGLAPVASVGQAEAEPA